MASCSPSAAPASWARPRQATSSATRWAAGDFNSDSFVDLAVGVSLEEVGSARDAGAVNVLSGSASRLTGVDSQYFTQDSPGVGSTAEIIDLFGDTLAVGDFNNDSFADLAVGAANEAVGASQGGGAVNVLLGSTGLLTGVGSQLFTQDSPGVGDAAEEGDTFGFALTEADFDNDTFADLAVGAPFEDAASVTDAGAINVLYGSNGLLTGAGSLLFTQGAAIGGIPEAFDAFGWALAGSGRKAPSHRRPPPPEHSARRHIANSLSAAALPIPADATRVEARLAALVGRRRDRRVSP